MKDDIKEKIKAYYMGDDIDKVLDYITNLQEENERLNLIIKAIKKQCDVTESYEINEFIRQLEEEPLDSTWLKRVAGESK